MRAIVCHEHGGPEVLRYETVSEPEPAAREVLIKTEAIGVNFVDTMRRSGKHPTAPKPPFTPGIELCGRIVALGPGADHEFAVGQRVFGRCITHGAYAEYVRVESRFTVPCPETLPADQAAALLVNGQTAYHALVTIGAVRTGDRVLITAAAGGVGTCAVQIAKLLGAHVIAVAGSNDKLDLVRRLAADVLVNYSEPLWPQRVLDATAGQGATLILESVGGDVFQGVLRCWSQRGRMVVYGKASGQAGVVTGDDLLFGHRSVFGLQVGAVIEDTQLLRDSMRRLVEWVEASQLRLTVGDFRPLSEAAIAHRMLEERGTTGKIVLIP